MTKQTTMTMTLPDGTTTGPFTLGDLKEATARLNGTPPMKEDPDFKKHNQQAFDVTAGELRQFIERYEQLDEEKAEVTGQQKELMAEAKGRGFDTRVMRKVIALRKQKPDQRAEEQAILDMYLSALGMD